MPLIKVPHKGFKGNITSLAYYIHGHSISKSQTTKKM